MTPELTKTEQAEFITCLLDMGQLLLKCGAEISRVEDTVTRMAKAYGKGTGFAIGLILLPNLFQLILAFGSSEYVGPQGKKN